MFSWFRRNKPPKKPLPTRVSLDGDTVQVFAATGMIESFRWDDVSSVLVYKQDCFAIDRIWMAFDVTGSPEPVCVHEECEGWAELVEQMQQRCTGFRADWWESVAFPAFAENLTVVWKRNGGVAAGPREPGGVEAP